MPIKYPIKPTLGAKVDSFPKVQQEKIIEIIDAINNPAPTIGGIALETIKVTLTPDQINAAGTPVELIPAQGAGKAIECMSLSANLKFNTSTYDAQQFGIGVVGAFLSEHAQFVSPQLWLNGSPSGWSSFRKNQYDGLAQPAPMVKENEAIVFQGYNSGSVGDSEVDLYITYIVHQV